MESEQSLVKERIYKELSLSYFFPAWLHYYWPLTECVPTHSVIFFQICSFFPSSLVLLVTVKSSQSPDFNLFLYFISHISSLPSPQDSISVRAFKFILSSLSPPPFSYFRPSDFFLGLCNSPPKLPLSQSPLLQFLLLHFVSQ